MSDARLEVPGLPPKRGVKWCDHHPSKWHDATPADMAELRVIDYTIEYSRCECGQWIHTVAW